MKLGQIKLDLMDIRVFVVVAMVGVLFYVLTLLALKPELANNELFSRICDNLTGVGGFGLVLMFLFGGSKASNEAASTVNELAKQATTIPPATDQMNVQADNVEVTKK